MRHKNLEPEGLSKRAFHCYVARVALTGDALAQAPSEPAPGYEVVASLASVRPGSPPPDTPGAWRALFDLPFEARRAELRRRLGNVFWTRELADALAEPLAARGDERRLEIAAGAGRFTAELVARGVDVIATDNYDQSAAAIAARRRALTGVDTPAGVAAGARREEDGIAYPAWVERRDAREAIWAYQPDLVLVAWPPLGSGMVPSLLAAADMPFGALLFIGEPGGCSEAPVETAELPAGWRMERWDDCERFLIGFTDHAVSPDDPNAFRRGRILFYDRLCPNVSCRECSAR